MKGAAIASVLKNIYSVLFGICDGLGVGSNFKGRLLVEILEEMKRIILFLAAGRKPLKVWRVWEIFATATSIYSKNYQSGVEIVKNKTCSLAGEGIMSFNNLKNAWETKSTNSPC